MENKISLTGSVVDIDLRFLTTGVKVMYIIMKVNNGDDTFSEVLIRIDNDFLEDVLAKLKVGDFINVKGTLNNYYYHEKLKQEVYHYCININELSIIFD